MSDEAIAAKRLRRRLERRWKSTRAEIDRVAYREACRKANSLINATRNQHRYQHIMELNGDSRRTWSAIKVLLHGESAQNYGKPAENATFCNTLSTFFVNKVRNIKSTIASVLTCRHAEPLSWDVPCRRLLTTFAPVTADEGRRGPPSAEVDAVEVVST